MFRTVQTIIAGALLLTATAAGADEIKPGVVFDMGGKFD